MVCWLDSHGWSWCMGIAVNEALVLFLYLSKCLLLLCCIPPILTIYMLRSFINGGVMVWQYFLVNWDKPS